MEKGEHEYEDSDMRWRFCKQTIRFWKKSKQKDGRESLSGEEAARHAPPEDDLSRQPGN